MKVIFHAFFLLIFCCVQSKAQFTSNSLVATNNNGKIQVNFTLQDPLDSSTEYTVFIRCEIPQDHDDMMGNNMDMDWEMPMNETQSDDEKLSCEELTATEPLSYCCTNMNTNCLTDFRDFSENINGVPIAGQEYTCFTSIATGQESDSDPKETPINVTSGRPPKPVEIDWIPLSSNTSLNIVVTARNNGLGDGLGATGLTYRVQVENGEGDVVYDETSDVQAFSVLLNSSDPDNYTITAWVINKYGTSEPIIEVAEVDEFIGTDPPTRTTGTPTDTPRSTTTEEITRDPGSSTGAIVGGVVGGLAALIIIVTVAALIVALLLVRNAKKKGSMTVKVSPRKNV